MAKEIIFAARRYQRIENKDCIRFFAVVDSADTETNCDIFRDCIDQFFREKDDGRSCESIFEERRVEIQAIAEYKIINDLYDDEGNITISNNDAELIRRILEKYCK